VALVRSAKAKAARLIRAHSHHCTQGAFLGGLGQFCKQRSWTPRPPRVVTLGPGSACRRSAGVAIAAGAACLLVASRQLCCAVLSYKTSPPNHDCENMDMPAAVTPSVHVTYMAIVLLDGGATALVPCPVQARPFNCGKTKDVNAFRGVRTHSYNDRRAVLRVVHKT
jgi:hypothetical protein